MPAIPYLDLTGQQFGRLTVLSEAPRLTRYGRRWLCRCDCGAERILRQEDIRHGNTRSCGCLHREQLAARMTTHGQARKGKRNRTYAAWYSMIRRCQNPKCPNYRNYGGRGITVCERWLIWENFLGDLGECPQGLTLERINSNGNYEPGNVRWATWQEQLNNTSKNRFLTFNGVTDTIAGWERRLGIPHYCISKRLRVGWSVERALTEPLHVECSHPKSR